MSFIRLMVTGTTKLVQASGRLGSPDGKWRLGSAIIGIAAVAITFFTFSSKKPPRDQNPPDTVQNRMRNHQSNRTNN